MKKTIALMLTMLLTVILSAGAVPAQEMDYEDPADYYWDEDYAYEEGDWAYDDLVEDWEDDPEDWDYEDLEDWGDELDDDIYYEDWDDELDDDIYYDDWDEEWEDDEFDDWYEDDLDGEWYYEDDDVYYEDWDEEDGDMYEDPITVEDPVLSKDGELILEDYSVLEIPREAVEVTDDDIQFYLEMMVYSGTFADEITEGTVQKGDTIRISYTGTVEGDEDFFPAEPQEDELVLGEDFLFPGLDEQLIGHKIGETVEAAVMIASLEEDDSEELEAKLSVTILCKIVYAAPELTDEFVADNSMEMVGVQLNTLDELKAFLRESLSESWMQEEILSALEEKAEIKSFPEEKYNLLKEYLQAELAEQAELYSHLGVEDYTEDMIAQEMGYATAEDYLKDNAMNYLSVIMIMEKIGKDLGVSVSEDEINAAIKEYMADYGYEEDFTPEQMREMNGEGWYLAIRDYEVLSGKVIEALAEKVVLTETEDEEE